MPLHAQYGADHMHFLKLLPAPLILVGAAVSALDAGSHMAREIVLASRSAGGGRESGLSLSGCEARLRNADMRRDGATIEAETLLFDLSRAILPAEADANGAAFEIRFAPPYAPIIYRSTSERTVATPVSSYAVRAGEAGGDLLARLRDHQARRCPEAG